MHKPRPRTFLFDLVFCTMIGFIYVSELCLPWGLSFVLSFGSYRLDQELTDGMDLFIGT